MRTLEVAFGLLVVAAAFLLALGAGRVFAPVPPAGPHLALALIALGATISAHGLAGRTRSAADAGSAVPWRAVFYGLLAITLAVALPLVSDLLDLATIAGFPLGYYAAAQGLLVLLAIIAFRAALHLDTRDRRQASDLPREDD